MSELTKFYTFAQMENAVVVNSLSATEKAGFPKEHAISPLEPNFYWEVNDEATSQHKLVIDLGSIQTCNCFVGLAKEELGTWWDLEVSDDETVANFRTVAMEQHDTVALQPTTELVKAYHFTNGNISGRYWRITIKGSVASNYYAPIDAKTAVAWVGTVYKLDRGGAYPLTDNEIYLTTDEKMSDGKVFSTGLNVNPILTMTRTYRVNEDEYTLLRNVVATCNGSYRPFMFHEYIDSSLYNRWFAHFESDVINELFIESGIRLVTIKFQTVPIVQVEKYH